ncbi:MAG: hypothetical protein GX175_03850 [Halanaerobiaceae bacterium]|nr:hypothetical protein [Halanaerobiaceae bacterium]
MLLELSTAFAMRCPECGRMEMDIIDIFHLSGKEKLSLQCECGTHKATISKKGSNYVSITYYCIICDREHCVLLPGKVFWSKKLLNSLVCYETDLNLGCFVFYELVNEELERQQEELNSMANDLGFDEFINPEIMLEILDYLHDIAAKSSLYCECGNHNINIELFSDRLEISCNNCYAVKIIPASTREDLSKIKKLDEIILNISTGRSKNF